MNDRGHRAMVQTLKNGCWNLLFALERQLMHFQIPDLGDTLLGNSSDLERRLHPIMPRPAQLKARRTSSTNLRSY